ncbi:hypothetical protein KCP71_04500 [Salmonella enterica subsp. enterica]|nr:hypothetical protein KCP71_04500 [Salmonella enterica subsp. enterica]
MKPPRLRVWLSTFFGGECEYGPITRYADKSHNEMRTMTVVSARAG